MFWLPLEHSCGCVIDWGCDDRLADQLAEDFLPAAAPVPCPMHGAATVRVAPPLEQDETRYIEASKVYYRAASRDQRENGRRNRKLALARRQ
jgi:hypothetical protein